MKLNILSYLAILFISLASCTKLEEKPAALLVTDQFYENEAQATAAVTAAYRKLYESGQSLYNGLFQIGVEMATDDYEAGPRARNAHVRAISGLTHDSSNDRMQELWRQSYSAISTSNTAIDRIAKIDGANISEAVRTRLINEAKFLRALHYFNLVRWFGGVPLVLAELNSLNPEDLYVAKATEDEVYQQIVIDLQAAETLPATYSDADNGRATSGAAKSLLAKVYLTHQDWQLAADKSKEVIDGGQYQLFPAYADVFNVATKNGREHIFSAQFLGNAGYQGNSLAGRSAPADVPGINGDYADALHVAGGLYQSFAATDTRRAVTFVTEIVSPVDGKLYTLANPQFHKYYDPAVVGNQSQSSKNLSIIRYAELLLIYAEAINEVSGASAAAYAAIDQVRTRAGIEKLQDSNPGLSKDAFREAVFQERRKELVYEYQRWFDLVRRGPDYYIKVLKGAGKTLAVARHVHFPTPQREIELNPKLTQHPDWVGF